MDDEIENALSLRYTDLIQAYNPAVNMRGSENKCDLIEGKLTDADF